MMSVSLSRGTLSIMGTRGDDDIKVELLASAQLRVTDNAKVHRFRTDSVRKVVADLGNGNDRYTSSPTLGKPQTLAGGRGDDTLNGGAGADRIYGGPGNDFLLGGRGADLFSGGEGTDNLSYAEAERGMTGVTVSLPAPGVETQSNVNGAPGENDRIRGDVEDLIGSFGDDALMGNAAVNVFYGQNGNDRLYGGAGNDFLSGGPGNDFLWGEQGADRMSGGFGLDDVRYDDDFHNAVGAGVVARLSTFSDPVMSGNGSAGENDFIDGDFEALIGTNYADVLTGNASDNYLAGLAGNDVLSGGAGNDTLDGGTDPDRLRGGEGNDLLLAKDGLTKDILDGGPGMDTGERDVISILISLPPKRDSAIGIEVFR